MALDPRLAAAALVLIILAMVFVFVKMLRILCNNDEENTCLSYEGSKNEMQQFHGHGRLVRANGDIYVGGFDKGCVHMGASAVAHCPTASSMEKASTLSSQEEVSRACSKTACIMGMACMSLLRCF